MSHPRNFDEAVRLRRTRHRQNRGCAVVCATIVAGIGLTFAVAFIDEATGLPVPREVFSIALLVNGALVAAGAAFDGWSSSERVADRVIVGLLAAGVGVVVYVVLVGFLGYALMDFI